jgi:hypothetical protein
MQLMPFQVSIRRLAEFTSIKVTGPASLPEFVQLIARLAEETRARADKRVLVDLLGVEGELKFTDHFQMGQEVGQRLQHLERLASVVPADKITRTSEKVAMTQGVHLRVFTSMNDAIRWLTQPRAPVTAIAETVSAKAPGDPAKT